MSDFTRVTTTPSFFPLFESAASPDAQTGPAQAAGHYTYGSFASGSIIASEVLMDHVVTRAHTLVANFTNSKASVGTNPAASWVGIIYKNGANVGTLTISTGGAITFASTGGADIAVAVGDVMTLTAPAVADTTIARLRFTFEGVA